MLDILVIITLILCLSQLMKGIGMVRANHFFLVSVCIGVVISVAYGGDNLRNAVAIGVGSAVCVNVMYSIGKYLCNKIHFSE